MYKIFYFTIILTLSLGFSYAQNLTKITEPIVIQFSGIVVTGDSAFGVPHVLIYVPKSMRGAETSEIGYFTMPALAGDSVIIKHIGYKDQYLILPDGKDKQSYTYVIELSEDSTMMAEISVLPYPTFQLFKAAFAKVDIPKDESENNWKENLSKKNLERMMLAMAPSSYESYRYYSKQEVKRIENSNIATINPLTNLFAWISLIEELSKRNKQKKKQQEEDSLEDEF